MRIRSSGRWTRARARARGPVLHYKTYRYARCCTLRIARTRALKRVLSLVCISINTRSRWIDGAHLPPLLIFLSRLSGRGVTLCHGDIFGGTRAETGITSVFVQPARSTSRHKRGRAKSSRWGGHRLHARPLSERTRDETPAILLYWPANGDALCIRLLFRSR